MELTERKRQILKVVVEDFIHTAEPVGSKAIAVRMGGSVSSATIRNELSDLTELGYLEQPHTSAGRVPSPAGYRLSQAGRAVSALVRYPAYAAAARRTSVTARRFDLLPVDSRNCIAVMMNSDSKVHSKLLQMQLQVGAEQFPGLVNLLNQHFTGISPNKMHQRLMPAAEQVSPQAFLLLSQVVSFGAEALEDAGQREVVIAGARQLLKLPEFRDADKAHDLMSFLADSKDDLPMPEHREMEILIGPENVEEALKDTSVVVASYNIGDNMRGLIGVVGPTRMDYAAVAARLSGFAEGLARLFGKELPPKEEQE